MELTLADRFPSLNPLAIRREKAREVFVLLGRLVDKGSRKEPARKKIRRPAGDDWF